ncbi:MAG: phage head closure protein [Tannerella sp.]|jgi:SPP1 family predicted phage head-tail adaptor|nr:phage head closure protein [Tannerella sp.]
MGQSERINPGSFMDQMEWFAPEKVQSESGFIEETLVSKGVFLATIVNHEGDDSSKEHEEVIKRTIVFQTWTNLKVNEEYQVLFEGVRYKVSVIKFLNRRLFAEYKCVDSDYVAG